MKHRAGILDAQIISECRAGILSHLRRTGGGGQGHLATTSKMQQPLLWARLRNGLTCMTTRWICQHYGFFFPLLFLGLSTLRDTNNAPLNHVATFTRCFPLRLCGQDSGAKSCHFSLNLVGTSVCCLDTAPHLDTNNTAPRKNRAGSSILLHHHLHHHHQLPTPNYQLPTVESSLTVLRHSRHS